MEERFLFRRVRPNDLNVFRCVVRYGYADARNEEEPFETSLVKRLEEFIRKDNIKLATRAQANEESQKNDDGLGTSENTDQQEVEMDIELVEKASGEGIVHFVGEQEIVAGKGANMGKRILIDYAYNCLTRNLRQSNEIFTIPQKRTLKFGIRCEL